MQFDHRSTKPGAPSSNLGGRTTTGCESGKSPPWPLTAAEIARFALNVAAGGGPNACHPWQGAPNRDGYGRFWLRGRMELAHRIALELKLGRALLPSEVARHSNRCTTRACCNQDHLSEGSQADNIRDRDDIGHGPRGERNGRNKLTADQVREIRRRLAAGQSRAAVALAFGVSKGSVQDIADGSNWSHLDVDAAVSQ